MHREFHSDAEIEHIGLGVTNRTLPKPEWTHAAHFAAALFVLSRREAHTMPALIRAYNAATGVQNTDTEGYHETITLASMRAAKAHRDAAPRAPLHVTLNALLRTELGRSDWLLAYWTRPLLFSSAARRTWAEPDQRALPFPDLEQT